MLVGHFMKSIFTGKAFNKLGWLYIKKKVPQIKIEPQYDCIYFFLYLIPIYKKFSSTI